MPQLKIKLEIDYTIVELSDREKNVINNEIRALYSSIQSNITQLQFALLFDTEIYKNVWAMNPAITCLSITLAGEPLKD